MRTGGMIEHSESPWSGPHHCAICAQRVEDLCQQFEADVQAGKYDADGYTSKDRRQQANKKGQVVKS